jgi:hypothetical protein
MGMHMSQHQWQARGQWCGAGGARLVHAPVQRGRRLTNGPKRLLKFKMKSNLDLI